MCIYLFERHPIVKKRLSSFRSEMIADSISLMQAIKEGKDRLESRYLEVKRTERDEGGEGKQCDRGP